MALAVASVPLLAVHLIAASIWVGGLFAVFVVARAASATLEPAARVNFFRTLGRYWGMVSGAALLIALATGAALLEDHAWDGLLIATAIVAAALLLATFAGVMQARAMTRLRARALKQNADDLDLRVRRGAALATGLRATIGLLTLALVVLAAVLSV